MIAIILFWISVAALVHTYLLYPALLEILAVRKTSGMNTFESPEELPGVSNVFLPEVLRTASISSKAGYKR